MQCLNLCLADVLVKNSFSVTNAQSLRNQQDCTRRLERATDPAHKNI